MGWVGLDRVGWGKAGRVVWGGSIWVEESG